VDVKGKRILIEGAQATLLDIDHGTYPFVTSSNPIAGAACTGTGVGPTRIDHVVGVAKAYTTRVGEGPFPTELTGEAGEFIRQRGGEYGATTGRPRRCGWLDLVALRFAVRINGFTALAITKLDVLNDLDEIKIACAYELDGQEINEYPVDIAALQRCRPVYESLPGWKQVIDDVRTFEDLPQAAKRYVKYLESRLDAPVAMAPGLGPVRLKRVWEHFDSMKRAWEADLENLRGAGLEQKIAEEIGLKTFSLYVVFSTK